MQHLLGQNSTYTNCHFYQFVFKNQAIKITRSKNWKSTIKTQCNANQHSAIGSMIIRPLSTQRYCFSIPVWRNDLYQQANNSTDVGTVITTFCGSIRDLQTSASLVCSAVWVLWFISVTNVVFQNVRVKIDSSSKVRAFIFVITYPSR